MEAHAQPEEPTQRDNTDEWRLAPERSLTSVAELEGRIDVAVATARSAEEAALEIGAASLEAAEQARRAAALAERASISAAQAAESARAAAGGAEPPAPVAEAVAESEPTAPVVALEPTPDAPPVAEGPEPAVEGPPAVVEDPEPAVEDAQVTARPGVEEPAMDAEPDAEAPGLAASPPTPAFNGTAPGRRDPDPFEDRIAAFKLRAERVMIRLQKIEAGAPPHEPTEVLRLR